MCLAIPMQVVELKGKEDDFLDPLVALVNADGIQKEIRLEMADRPPKIGEYVIIHAGFAIHTLTEEEAQFNLDLMRQMAEGLEKRRSAPRTPIMKCADEFRSRDITAPLLAELKKCLTRPVRIMEVCGTHTMSIFRHGIRSLLPEGITLLSGPGCPVCVTPASHIDAFISAADLPDVIVATFGDLIRVPGSKKSLAAARAEGAKVEIVYSPMDALEMARKEKDKKIVFPAIGFETTVPTIAATILAAEQQQIDNFFIISAGKTMPQALKLLMSDPALEVDGLLCPGHVSAIIGASAYQPLAKKYNLSCAVAGFEPADILAGLLSIIKQINNGRPEVDNCYTRVVTDKGNLKAQELINHVFIPEDSEWRGLGVIPGSGLQLREKLTRFDAVKELDIPIEPTEDPKGCKCGEILKGLMLPPDCPLYGKRCTPLQPVGPCMVSNEGTCAAYHRYSEKR